MTKYSTMQRIGEDVAPLAGSLAFACLLGIVTLWITQGAEGVGVATPLLVVLLVLVIAPLRLNMAVVLPNVLPNVLPDVLPNVLAVAALGLALFSQDPFGSPACALLWPVLGCLANGQRWQEGLVASAASLVGLLVLGPILSTDAVPGREAGAQAGVFALGVSVAFAVAAGLMAQRARASRTPSVVSAPADTQGLVQQALLQRDQAQADAEEARAQTRQRALFMAEMSHEIRTPLNAILGFADTMREGVLGPMPPVYQDYPALIHSSGTHLLDLVSDMLDLSKVEAGKFETHLKPLRLDEIAGEGVRLSSGAARSAGVQIRHEATGPIEVQGDARALRQIIFNLLSNAIKFTPRDGRVSVRTRIDRVLRTACLEVEDTGMGMSAADLAKIGEPWTQVGNSDDSTTKRPRGSGLGLALVKRLADLQGGTFSMTSTLGQGSVARVTLPLERGK